MLALLGMISAGWNRCLGKAGKGGREMERLRREGEGRQREGEQKEGKGGRQ